MGLFNTDGVARETRQAYKKALGNKKNPTRAERKEAKEEARRVMESKYGASPDWAKIFKIVMAILSLLAGL